MLISGVEQEFWNILVKTIYPLDTRNFSNAKFVYAILSRIFFEMYKIKKFLVSSGYMKLDLWNFLSSTSEIFDFEIWNFLLKKKLNFSKFLMSREKIFIQYFEIFMACYKVHGPKFWILDPFCAFLPSFPGRNVQKIHRQSNLQAFEQSLQILLLSSRRIISGAGSSGSEAFHSSESIFASSWKSAKENDFCSRNFLFFPSWGSFALNVGRFRGFWLLSKKASFSFIESISCLWHSWKYSKCIEQKLETYVEILCQYLGVVQSYLLSFFPLIF